MTDPHQQWMDWTDFKNAYEQLKDEPNKLKKTMTGTVGYRVLGVLRRAAERLNLGPSGLQVDTQPKGLVIGLGSQKAPEYGIWFAEALLSPVHSSWGAKGIREWGYYLQEGLNFWLSVYRAQPREVFRVALQHPEVFEQFINLLYSLPQDFSPVLMMNADITTDKELKRQFPEAEWVKHANPFKHTPITPENHERIRGILQAYARKRGKSTLMAIDLAISSEHLQQSEPHLESLTEKALLHLNTLAVFITEKSAEFEEEAARLQLEAPPVADPEEAVPTEEEEVPPAPETISLAETVRQQEASEPPSALAQEILRIFGYTRNIMLFGPPGTGKTHVISQVKKHLLHHMPLQVEAPVVSSTAPQSNALRDRLLALPRWQVLALTMYLSNFDQNNPVNIADLVQLSPLKEYEEKRKISSLYGTLYTTFLERAVGADGEALKYPSTPKLFYSPGKGLWTLTEEGKGWVRGNLSSFLPGASSLSSMPEAALSLASELYTPPFDIDERFCFTTLHQAFSYEEFIEGFRPVEASGDNPGGFALQDGVFKSFSNKARRELEEAQKAGREALKFLLVLDESNRANLAKVLGELITLLEDDKRIGTKNPHQVTLPYSKSSFGVPSNLYLLATMNTADRSIALLDVALRRRFTFIECMPDPEVLSTDVDFEDISISLKTLLTEMNLRITGLLDRDHQIGHAYLTSVSGPEELQYTWYYKVIPLLQEYFYNDGAKLHGLIGGDFILLDKDAAGDGFGFSGRTRQSYTVNTKLRHPEALPDFMVSLSKLVARWRPHPKGTGAATTEIPEEGPEILEA
ncbi:AAA family ATPase [Deinococcus roseus]|uniref:AAA+ ATPase domain-containing protein n=1 Tax=Deinococcus roseus TaxID=392414 RepID=A0ABQ2CV03_9DEIO|nr:AAA family ATPase [Deinococcus roseus]GGJ23531.1 hypothetical protein GCM10008938_07120 [Deinococcus roseus]